MHRHEADRGVLLDQRLGAVAVVHVPVDDEHAVRAVRLGVPRRDHHVVHETEAHRARRQGVVPRRAGRGERGAGPACIAAVTAATATPAEACIASQLRGPEVGVRVDGPPPAAARASSASR